MVKTLTLLTLLFGNAQHHEAPLEVASAALSKVNTIPVVYTCHGRNRTPPVQWRHVPPGTRSLVILMNEERAPQKKSYLWAVYNIPPQLNQLKSGADLVRGERYAINSLGHMHYDGPCSEQGRHHYLLTLYALDVRFYFKSTPTVEQLKNNMHSHIIAQAQVASWYGQQVFTRAPHLLDAPEVPHRPPLR